MADLNAAVQVKAGTLQQMQRAEELVGAPVDDWDGQSKAKVIIAILTVYFDMTQDQAGALSLEEATKLINGGGGASANP